MTNSMAKASKLLQVGGLVAVQEELHGQVAGHGIRRGQFRLCGADIVRQHFTLTTKYLYALIVSVHSLATVVDNAQGAIGKG